MSTGTSSRPKLERRRPNATEGRRQPLSQSLMAPTLAAWEYDRVDRIALRTRTTERDDLRAELARLALSLKVRRLRGVKDWQRYLTACLRNRALNWVRDERAIKGRTISIDDDVVGWVQVRWLAEAPVDLDLQVTVSDVLATFPPPIQRLCCVLVEQGGCRTSTGRRLGLHRNTVTAVIRRVAAALRARLQHVV